VKVVAIDGPSGSGKSTVARRVAAALGLEVLDTGAVYRAVALVVLDQGLDPTDAEGCVAAADGAVLDMGERVRLGERDITDAIRTPEVTAAVSTVSAHPGVRAILVQRQRDWAAERGGGVVEGRDIGSVVFPDATLKVFLTASEEERARRRQRDEVAAARDVDVAAVRDAIDRRDRLDSTRAVSPLVAAPDALVVDTTGRTPDDIVDEIVAAFTAATSASR
jgi:cytidylate kinase